MLSKMTWQSLSIFEGLWASFTKFLLKLSPRTNTKCKWRKFVITLHSVEKSSKTRSPFLRENQHFPVKSTFSRQINVFTKEVTKELISRKFFSVIAFYSIFPHCALFWQKFRESNVFTKELISRNIFFVRWNVSFFHTVIKFAVPKSRIALLINDLSLLLLVIL